MNPIPAHARHQRGTTLVEALIAFLVLSLGMLAVARVQAQFRIEADIARQRSEAVRLAQEDIETLRAFSVLAAASGAHAWADIASASSVVDSSSGYASNTRYTVARDIDAVTLPNAKTLRVAVHWADRGGAAQQVVLNSIISGSDPALAGALAIAPGDPVAAFGRSPRIPRAAKDLGDGRSALKPVSAGTAALVFDNRSGLVIGRCTGVNAATPTDALTPVDLMTCDAHVGLLLRGTVRFSSNSPPDPAQARDAPLAHDIALGLTGGPYPAAPSCASEALKTVSFTRAGSLHVEAVPIAATPASIGLATWSDTGDRFVAYHCVVIPPASGRWSGRSLVAPIGWTIGLQPGARRVCRYSADLDASGASDANLEHPAHYSDVETALPHQNFLVVDGLENCPVGAAIQVTGTPADVFADLSTSPHQP
ncbi:MAG: hypothetical protein ABIP61_02230 [Burkholderiaceae bacterium]